MTRAAGEPIPQGRKPWRAVLSGDRLAATLRIIDQIAAALRARGARHPGWGSALFFAQLYRASRQPRDAAAATESLEYNLEHPPETFGLFGGLTGLAWTAHSMAAALDLDTAELCATTDSLICEALGHGLWQGAYDLFSGLAGWGVYLASRPADPSARQGLLRIEDQLQRLARRDEHGVAWLTSRDLGSDTPRTFAPTGLYDLGVAHGLPGVVGVLGEAFAARVSPELCLELAEGAVRWLSAHRLRSESGAGLPAWVLPKQRGTAQVARTAWCYGDLGTSVALLGASRRMGRADWELQAVELGLMASARPFDQSGVVDAGFCHGASGNAHLFNRLYQATGREAFLEAALVYYDKALELTGEGERMGSHSFMVRRPREPSPSWTADASLLDGAAGLGLALQAAVHEIDPVWDRLFLASAGSDPRP
jgi:hypothetical protein